MAVGLDLTVLNVALPTISRDLRASGPDLEWTVDVYTVAFAALMLPAGQLGDRFGRKRLLLGGLGLFSASSVLAVVSRTTGELIAARTLMGLSAAFVMPLALAIVPSLFAPEERSRAIAFITAAMGAGLPLGPVVGGMLLDRYSWGAVFWVNVPVGTVALLGIWLLVPKPRRSSERVLDLKGALCGSSALTGVVYGLVRGAGNGWGTPLTVTSLLVGAIGLVAFLHVERSQRAPLVELGLFHDRGFAFGTVAGVGVSVVLYGLLFTLPQFFQVAQGNSPLSTGLRLVPLMAGLIIGGLAASSASTRSGLRWTVAAGLLLLAAGAAVLGLVSVRSGLGVVVLGLGLAGCGVGCAMTPAMDAVLGALPDGETGAGASCNTALRQVGGALAVAVLGGLLSRLYVDRLSPSLDGVPPRTLRRWPASRSPERWRLQRKLVPGAGLGNLRPGLTLTACLP